MHPDSITPCITSRRRLPSYNTSNITDHKKSKGIHGLENHLDGTLILTDAEDGNSPPPPFSSSVIAPSTPRIIRFEHDHPKYIICQIGHEPEMATAVKAQFYRNSIGYPSSLVLPLCSHNHDQIQVGDEVRINPGVYSAFPPRKLVHD